MPLNADCQCISLRYAILSPGNWNTRNMEGQTLLIIELLHFDNKTRKYKIEKNPKNALFPLKIIKKA